MTMVGTQENNFESEVHFQQNVHNHYDEGWRQKQVVELIIINLPFVLVSAALFT